MAQSQRSLIVELKPEMAHTESDVLAFFKSIFGDVVHSCVLQRETRNLHRWLKLEATARTMFCCCRRRIQSSLREQIHIRRDRLSRLDVDADLQSAIVKSSVYSSTAFVTFRSVLHRVIAEQSVLSSAVSPHKNIIVSLRGAPEAQDIIWANMAFSNSQLKLRFAAVQLLLLKVLIGWGVIMSAIYFASSLDQLRCLSDTMAQLIDDSGPFVRTHLNTYLPQWALLVLLVALPTILQLLAIFVEKRKTKAEVERVVLVRTLMFQLITIYVTVLYDVSSYKLLNQQKEVDAGSISQVGEGFAEFLRDRIPRSGVYFFTFVCARIGVSLPLLLLRPWDLVLYQYSDGPFLAPWSPGIELASAAMVLTVASTYLFVAPLVLPVCTLYFGVASLVYRYLFRYVYTPDFDCGGMFWFDVFHVLMIGLLVGTLSLGAVLFLYAPKGWEYYASAPLVVAVCYLYWFCYSQFWNAGMFMSYEDARRMESSEDVADQCLDENYYQDPVLSYRSSYTDVLQGINLAERNL
eukprot:TRINITY_DN39038_c0_g1_i1.p1 TRINITY_DN39038_c0_g1~~TRINITY_DN39038_c0_g1_i1.p1  ORF type:complete len:591 (+),score=59.66 TRINITY_DN39038_c0_g1_i1:215-1774(+)